MKMTPLSWSQRELKDRATELWMRRNRPNASYHGLVAGLQQACPPGYAVCEPKARGPFATVLGNKGTRFLMVMDTRDRKGALLTMAEEKIALLGEEGSDFSSFARFLSRRIGDPINGPIKQNRTNSFEWGTGWKDLADALGLNAPRFGYMIAKQG